MKGVKKQMAKVLLGDVVDHVKDKVDKDTTDLEFYVGGEHIDSDEITVRRRGRIEGSTIGPAFHMRFQQGDVLLMSRNPHLRKASMVDFDGICSDVSYVCRTKDNSILLQSLLPFILQTPEFWQFAEENKKGGLPFFLNWKDFARFEFELLSIERQQQISDLLWAMERVKNAYRELIARTDDLVKSQFIEMFGDPELQHDGLTTLGKHIDIINGFAFKGELFGNTGLPVIKIGNVNRADFNKGSMQFYEYDSSLSRFEIYPGDVLISLTGTVGKDDFGNVCMVAGDYDKYYLNQRNAKLVLHDELVPEYLIHLLKNDYIRRNLIQSGTGVRQCHLHNKDLEGIKFLLPERKKQEMFAAFTQQSDKSKFAAQQTLKELTDAQRALMKKIFE